MTTPVFSAPGPRTPRRLIVTGLLGLLWAAQPSAAQLPSATLRLRVLDETGAPVPGARLQVSGVPKIATSDSAGTAELSGIPPGLRLVEVFSFGYQLERVPIEFAGAEPVEMDVDLIAIPVEHAELIVIAREQSRKLRQNGFYERERQGIGSYVGKKEAERYQNLPDLYFLISRLRGFRVRRGTGGEVQIVSMRGNCRPQVLIDGFPAMGWVLSTLTPGQIDGIEAYPGRSGVPPALQAASGAGPDGCGLIAIWTKY